MNTLVRIQGYVTDAHVLEPYAKHSYDIKRYELHYVLLTALTSMT